MPRQLPGSRNKMVGVFPLPAIDSNMLSIYFRVSRVIVYLTRRGNAKPLWHRPTGVNVKQERVKPDVSGITMNETYGTRESTYAKEDP